LPIGVATMYNLLTTTRTLSLNLLRVKDYGDSNHLKQDKTQTGTIMPISRAGEPITTVSPEQPFELQC